MRRRRGVQVRNSGIKCWISTNFALQPPSRSLRGLNAPLRSTPTMRTTAAHIAVGERNPHLLLVARHLPLARCPLAAHHLPLAHCPLAARRLHHTSAPSHPGCLSRQCSDTRANQVASFVPPPLDASPPLPAATLTVFPDGHELLDHLLVSALVVERKITLAF